MSNSDFYDHDTLEHLRMDEYIDELHRLAELYSAPDTELWYERSH
jgi:hypothetical protein